MRPSGRAPDQMRELRFEPGFTRHAEGACLVSFGDTRVLCTASVEDKVPPCLRGKGQGWVTPADGSIIGAQVTAEGECYDEEGLLRLLPLAPIGCSEIFAAQLKAAA